MKVSEEKSPYENVDILGSIEFDLTEAIKDLIANIKFLKKEVETIKKHLP
jgi:hypothetical protein